MIVEIDSRTIVDGKESKVTPNNKRKKVVEDHDFLPPKVTRHIKEAICVYMHTKNMCGSMCM